VRLKAQRQLIARQLFEAARKRAAFFFT